MPAIIRISIDRRSGEDRRVVYDLDYFRNDGVERRKRNKKDRRTQEERRNDWIRVSKWSSVNFQELKIAKYVH